MLVCQIAEILLEERSPLILETARDLLSEFEAFFPRQSTFVSAATWLDNIHEDHLRTFATWHYRDKAYVDKDFLDDYTVAPLEEQNLVWALETQIYPGLRDKKMSPWGRAFYIRGALHLLGDLHQPLHNIGRFSQQFPHSDQGGNGCKVSISEPEFASLGINNMHKVLDSAGGLYPFDPFFAGQPLKQEYLDALKSEAARLIASEHGQSLAKDFDWNAKVEVGKWSDEGYDVAVRQVWLDANATGESDLAAQIDCKGSSLPAGYLSFIGEICQHQILLGGYRLALFLSESLPIYYDPVNVPVAKSAAVNASLIIRSNESKDDELLSLSSVALIFIALGTCCLGMLFVLALRGLREECSKSSSSSSSSSSTLSSSISTLLKRISKSSSNHPHEQLLNDAIEEEV